MMRFPFRSHRTMAEVAETEELLARSRSAGKLKLTGYGKGSFGGWHRLNALLSRADLNNPPRTEEPDDAA